MANHVFDEQEYVFGSVEDAKGSKDDLLHLAAEVASSDGPKPKLYQYCGTEDFF
jgi:putative tributyrin esterase